jgi:hypothetical protein
MPTKPRTPKPTLHFEQIPVDAVKKLVPSPVVRERGRTGTDEVVAPPKPRKGERSADAGHFHGVQFYNDPDALCRIVGGFLGQGFDQDALAVVIATPDHAARIDACLRMRGIDVEALKRRGQFVAIDAREVLDHFMIDGMPNATAFRRAVGAILNQVRRGRQHCAIRAYGEMVDLLWRDGSEAAAIRLETLWNQLAGSHDFELLCGYSMGNFYKGAALDEIKQQHTHLVTDDGHAAGLQAGKGAGSRMAPSRQISLAS